MATAKKSETAALKKMSVGGLDMPAGQIRLTKVGAVLADDLPFEDYLKLGEKLTVVGEAWQWWWGDYLNQGEQKYGETYAQAVNESGYATGTLMNAASVCGRIEISRRREILSFGHHAAVAYIEDAAVQDRLLEAAGEGGWSVTALREAVREYHRDLNGKPKKEKKAAPPAERRDEYGDDDEGTDLAKELAKANAEIARLEKQVEVLSAEDKNAENAKLLAHVDALEGRLNGSMRERKEALTQVKYYQRLTEDIRKALKVENNVDIRAKLQALVKG